MIADFDFEIHITASLDMHDGLGVVTEEIIANLPYTTIANNLPTADVTSVVITQKTVNVVVNVTDIDSVITDNLIAVLYDQAKNIIGTQSLVEGVNNVSFASTFTSSTLYEVLVYADYDLRDAGGVHADAILDEYKS